MFNAGTKHSHSTEEYFVKNIYIYNGYKLKNIYVFVCQKHCLASLKDLQAVWLISNVSVLVSLASTRLLILLRLYASGIIKRQI